MRELDTREGRSTFWYDGILIFHRDDDTNLTRSPTLFSSLAPFIDQDPYNMPEATFVTCLGAVSNLACAYACRLPPASVDAQVPCI